MATKTKQPKSTGKRPENRVVLVDEDRRQAVLFVDYCGSIERAEIVLREMKKLQFPTVKL